MFRTCQYLRIVLAFKPTPQCRRNRTAGTALPRTPRDTRDFVGGSLFRWGEAGVRGKKRSANQGARELLPHPVSPLSKGRGNAAPKWGVSCGLVTKLSRGRATSIQLKPSDPGPAEH